MFSNEFIIANKKMEKRRSCLSLKEREILFKILSETIENPKSELVFHNIFELLCAVVLSAQTTDVAVNRVTGELFKRAPTPSKMAALSLEEISMFIRTLGLYRNKAKHLKELSMILDRDYEGIVPCSYEELVSLPGVGSKTAKVVLNVGFNKPTIAIDTHIFRVINRTGLCCCKSVVEGELYLEKIVPKSYLLSAHHLLLLHGRYICTARHPKCAECKLTTICRHLGFN